MKTADDILDQIPELLQLKDSALREKNKVIVDGKSSVLKLLKNNLFIDHLIAGSDFIEEYRDQIDQLVQNLHCIEKSELLNIPGQKYHGGIIAITDRPKHALINNISGTTVILNGVTSPENVGSICRSMAAFGVKNLIVDEKSCGPFLRRAIRVSLGNSLFLNVFHILSLENGLDILKQKNYQIVATANEEGAIPISDLEMNPSMAFIIGSEGHGIDQNIKRLCDQIAKIEISELTSHLNAAVSTAIFLYQYSIAIK